MVSLFMNEIGLGPVKFFSASIDIYSHTEKFCAC